MLARYAARFDALRPREQLLLVLGGLAVVFVLVYLGWIEPMSKRRTSAEREAVRIETESKTLITQIGNKLAERSADPDAENRRLAARLREQVDQLDARLRERSADIVPPDKIQSVLERLLARNRKVELVSLRTLPLGSVALEAASADQREAAAQEKAAGATNPAGGAAENTRPPAPAADATKAPAGAAAGAAGADKNKEVARIYRHGVEVTLRGNYFDLLAYLKDLEALPLRIYWSSMDLNASRYPETTLKLTVYTVSLDTTWLAV